MIFNRCFVITFIFLLCFGNDALTQIVFPTKNSVWLGGAFNLSSIGESGSKERNRLIMISPFIRFFANRSIFLGPRFQLTGLHNKDKSTMQMGTGLDFGLAYSITEHFIPFSHTGGQFDIYRSDSQTQAGFSFPFGFGMFIKTKSIFALQLEAAGEIKWVEKQKITIFSISLGFAGIGKRHAVSVLGGTGSIYY